MGDPDDMWPSHLQVLPLPSTSADSTCHLSLYQPWPETAPPAEAGIEASPSISLIKPFLLQLSFTLDPSLAPADSHLLSSLPSCVV